MNTIDFLSSFVEKEEMISPEKLRMQLKEYELYFNKRTMYILNRAINLDSSILTDVDINIRFGELEIFRNIAIYNIINRCYNVMVGLGLFDRDKIYCNMGKDYLYVYYKGTQNYSCTIFEASLGKGKKMRGNYNDPVITIYETQIESEIKKKQDRLKYLEGKEYPNDSIPIGYDINGKIVYTPTFGGRNAKARFDDMMEIQSIQNNLIFLQEEGNEIDEITKMISLVFEKEWNICIESAEIKNYGWVEIEKVSSLE